MSEPTPDTTPRSSPPPIRLWPAILLGVLVAVLRFGAPQINGTGLVVGILGGVIGALAIGVWWLFFSGALWRDRLAAVGIVVVALAATRLVLHPSVSGGMMGMMYYLYALPTVGLAFVGWAVVTRRMNSGIRRSTMACAILVACGAWALVRTGGISGGGDSDLHWRWTKSPEERLLAMAQSEPKAEPSVGSLSHKEIEWPGFRGPNRDSVVHGARIETDWAKFPPTELWRRQIGPGWSSFAVWGDRIFTQEQRGEDEIVACYDAATGDPIWRHADAARFWESNAGAGPRATPTIFNARVYALGATGILNVLAADTGSVVWSRNPVTETGIQIPGWGISGSPLIVGNQVVVAASGRLVCYDLAAGDRRWEGPSRRGSYSSPHLVQIDGVPQIVMTGGAGVFSVDPTDGRVLWEHAWEGSPMLQPARLDDGNLLVTTASPSGGAGLKRLAIEQIPGQWKVAERWTSSGLKPYFNDFVVHQGHAYGFDGAILACIELGDGKRKWKGGRYGHGQLLLMADQGLLLVLSEEGELALVKATPDGFKELARHAAITGKTWNHPVLVNGVLYVRNGEEMAAFRLALTDL